MNAAPSYSRLQAMGLALLLSGLLAACGGDGGRDPVLGTDGVAVLAPTVTAVSPVDGSSAVSIGTPAISASFSEAMAPLSRDARFTVSCAAPCTNPAGAVSLDAGGRIARFTPAAPLQPQTLYTATVSGATSLATGLALASPTTWRFTTGAAPDTTRPLVTLTEPVTTVPGPTLDVPPATPVTAVFNEDMLAAGFTAASFTLTCAAPCVSPAGTVGYTAGSRTARFTPNAPLATGTAYTATITSAVTDLAGNALAGNQAAAPAPSDYVWSFVTQRPPSVTAVAPVNNASGVPIDGAVISVAFSEPVAPLTGSASFTVTCAAPCTNPTGSVGLDASSRIASFTLTPGTTLMPLTDYTATVTGVTSLATGLAMAAPAQWTFRTGATADTTRPRVTQTLPLTTTPGPTPGVATNSAISAAFTEDMVPGTLTNTSFTLTCALPCVAPAGNVSYAVGTRTAVLTPSAVLVASTTYTATVTTAATDLAGNALAGNQAALPAASAYVWSFTTGAAADTAAPTVISTNPADGAVGVCVNKTLSARFSEPMNPLSLTTASFTLTAGGANVIGIVSYDVLTDIASFNPVANLVGTPATLYTATLKGGANGVRDLAGNTLAADKVIRFTTNASTCVAAPALGAAAPFGAFGGNATLTNDGLQTVINGDVGVNAASTTITGLRDGGGNVYTVTLDNDGMVNGLVHTLTAPPGSVAGAAVTQARADALVAFNSISPGALPGGIDVSSLAQCPSCGGAGGGADELAGRTLPPGVYQSATGTYDIGGAGRTTGNLTLDAGGDANAVWVFQAAAGIGTLNVGLTGPSTPAVPIKILLINGAQPKNVFWYVPAGATIGTAASIVGSLLADAAITLSTTGGSPPTAVLTTLDGRAIALTAGVTMTNAVINVPAP